MGIIERTNEILNSELPTDSSLYTRVLGVAIPVDPFITGTVRFARKIGDFTSLIMADNTTSLFSDAFINSTKITTNEIIDWIVIGSRILVQDSELMTVRDFSTDVTKNQMTIEFEEKFRVDHPAGSKVLLQGHPVVVTGIQTPVVTQVFTVTQVDTTGLVTGVVGRRYVQLNANPVTVITVTDQVSQTALPWTNPVGTNVVAFPTAPFQGVVVTYEVPQTLTVQSTVRIFPFDDLAIRYGNFAIQTATLAAFLNGIYTYQIQLGVGVRFPPSKAGKGAKDGYAPQVGDTIYLRCYPCYESKPCPIPTIPPQDTNLGPLCFDWLSGVTVENTSYEERMTVTSHDAALNPIGTRDMEKNHLILQEPIRSDALLFWDVLRGHINWNGSEVLAKPDNLGVPEFQAHYKCVAPFNGDGQITSWRLRFVNPNATHAQVTVTLDPVGPQVFVVPPNTTQYLKIVVPQTTRIERIYVALVGVVPDPNDPSKYIPGGTLSEFCRFGAWVTDGSVVQFLSYRLIAKVDSRFKWGSTGAIVKPLFLNIEYLRARLDLSAQPNNGKIFF